MGRVTSGYSAQDESVHGEVTMSKQSAFVLGTATLLTVVGLLFPPPEAVGRGGPVSQATLLQEESEAESKARRGSRRLPLYYARVVSSEQRERIYEIQAEYAEEIEVIENELKEKMSERDLAIEAVLSVEQLDEVKRWISEAKKRRAQRQEEKKTTGNSGEADSDR